MKLFLLNTFIWSVQEYFISPLVIYSVLSNKLIYLIISLKIKDKVRKHYIRGNNFNTKSIWSKH